MKLFGEVIILFGFETENAKPKMVGAWTDQDKLSEWLLNNRHTMYAFEPVRLPENGVCAELLGFDYDDLDDVA